MKLGLPILLGLTLTASAQTWTNPTPQMLAASNAVAFMSTAPWLYYSNGVAFGSLCPLIHLAWDWPHDPLFIYGTDTNYPVNVNAVIQENDALATPIWTTVWQSIGTNCFLPMTNQMGFFRATSTWSQ